MAGKIVLLEAADLQMKNNISKYLFKDI